MMEIATIEHQMMEIATIEYQKTRKGHHLYTLNVNFWSTYFCIGLSIRPFIYFSIYISFPWALSSVSSPASWSVVTDVALERKILSISCRNSNMSFCVNFGQVNCKSSTIDKLDEYTKVKNHINKISVHPHPNYLKYIDIFPLADEPFHKAFYIFNGIPATAEWVNLLRGLRIKIQNVSFTFFLYGNLHHEKTNWKIGYLCVYYLYVPCYTQGLRWKITNHTFVHLNVDIEVRWSQRVHSQHLWIT